MTINGQMRVLKIGQKSPEGVKLVASDSQQAVLEVAGETVKLGVSERISSSFAKADVVEVRIPQGSNGHYHVGGFINGRSVEFMVDTGATMIAMSMNRAKQLGIGLKNASRSSASTAGGVVDAFVVTADKVIVGGITVYKVPVMVLEGEFPTQVLLGNSFLKRVDLSEKSGVLVLRQKY